VPGSGYTNSGEFNQLYVFDAEAEAGEEFVCATCPPDGSEPRRHVETKVNDGLLITGYDRTKPRRLIANGDEVRVYFDAMDDLLPRDTNGEIDVYEFDLRSRKLTLLSTGRDTAPSYLLDVSPSGSDVFIGTFDRLVGADKDQLFDIYSVRVGGGFKEQIEQAPCRGDACRDAGADPDGLEFGTNAGSGDDPGATPSARPAAMRLLGIRYQRRGRAAQVRVRVSGAGRVKVSGKWLRPAVRSVAGSGTVTIPVRLKTNGRKAMNRQAQMRVRAKVVFRARGGGQITRSTVVMFRARGSR
jgi:hypothetical protein